MIVKKKKGYERFGFIDIFILDREYGISSVILELKCISLLGLYYGQIGRCEEPSYIDLKDLDDNLRMESEYELLHRVYFYWSKEDQRYKKTIVKQTVDDGMCQLNKYINTVKNGKATNSKPGICDSKIKIKIGSSVVGGFLIVTIGSQRIITREISFSSINYQFFLV